MGCGADDLYAPLVGLMVGLGTLEARQERVVDVDDAPEQSRREPIGQHLHVPRQHHQFGAGAVHQIQQPLFLLDLVVPADRPAMVGQAGGLGRSLRGLVVRYHRRDIGSQPTHADLIKQVFEHVVEARHHDQDLGPAVSVDEVELHAEAVFGRAERLPERVGGHLHRSREADAQKEPVGVAVPELRALGDVAAEVGEAAGHGRDDAGPVFAGQGENVVLVGHGGQGQAAGRPDGVGQYPESDTPESDKARSRIANLCRRVCLKLRGRHPGW